MTQIKKISKNNEFDNGPVKHRIGLIALHTDETTERDYHRMLPADGKVMYYTSRVRTLNPVTFDNLKKMGPQLGHTAGLLLPDTNLHVITYSCTSGTLAIGYDEVAAQIRSGTRNDIEVVTPLTAACVAAHTLGLKSLSLLVPYTDKVTQAMCDNLESNDLKIKNASSLYVESDVDIARLRPVDIKAAALETWEPGADALFILCTALRSAEIIDELEAELGIPVLSSNQCMFWQALRLSGYSEAVAGFGRLLQQ